MNCGTQPRLWISLLLLIALQPAWADAEREGGVHEWLQRMVESVHTLNYDGIFVYLHDNHMETMRIIHSNIGGEESERLISLNGTAREVIRDNASVTCVTPDSKTISVGKRMLGQGFRAVFSADTHKLAEYYDFQMIGESRVANHKTRIFAVIPRDEMRYGYRIHLDVRNALPLKTDMLDSNGDAVSQIMFTNIRLQQQMESKLDSVLDGKEHYNWSNETPRRLLRDEDNRWAFKRLPRGFEKIHHSQRASLSLGGKLDHIVLSDGLATVSLYIEDQTHDEFLQGFSKMGAINAFGLQVDGYHATAVGEVPAGTVEAIATALIQKR